MWREAGTGDEQDYYFCPQAGVGREWQRDRWSNETEGIAGVSCLDSLKRFKRSLGEDLASFKRN